MSLFARSFVFVDSCIYALIHSFVHVFFCSLVCLSIHSFIHSFRQYLCQIHLIRREIKYVLSVWNVIDGKAITRAPMSHKWLYTRRWTDRRKYTAVQNKNTIIALFQSKQLLPFSFVHYYKCAIKICLVYVTFEIYWANVFDISTFNIPYNKTAIFILFAVHLFLTTLKYFYINHGEKMGFANLKLSKMPYLALSTSFKYIC